MPTGAGRLNHQFGRGGLSACGKTLLTRIGGRSGRPDGIRKSLLLRNEQGSKGVAASFTYRDKAMALSLKMVAQEILMCGLKQVPILGTAIEVVEQIKKRHDNLQEKERSKREELDLTTFEKRMRELVSEEIKGTIR